MVKYHILAFFENSVELSNGLEEILRERISRYKKMAIPLDFWLFKDLKLNNLLSNNENSNLITYRLVTTNETFINWLKLRYGYFPEINNFKIPSNIKTNEITLDGYYYTSKNFKNFFNSKNLFD